MVVTVPPFRRKFTVYSRTKDGFLHFSLLLFKNHLVRWLLTTLKPYFLHFFIKKPHPGTQLFNSCGEIGCCKNYENSLKIFPNSCQDQD